MIYAIVVLVITLKVQLSIIGGYLYKDPTSISTEMQEKYLSMCQAFMKQGIDKLRNIMETEVMMQTNIFILVFIYRVSHLRMIP